MTVVSDKQVLDVVGTLYEGEPSDLIKVTLTRKLVGSFAAHAFDQRSVDPENYMIAQGLAKAAGWRK